MIDFKEELAKYKPILGDDDLDVIVNPTVYLNEVKDIIDLLKEITTAKNKE
jgi:hypothetical protein